MKYKVRIRNMENGIVIFTLPTIVEEKEAVRKAEEFNNLKENTKYRMELIPVEEEES